jgi:ABC-type bacteriocin/lantibiotic exporter with double-glycine peptidase domain
MGRKHVTPVVQPDDSSCGPASIKHALEILGKRRSLESLKKLCKTSRNGTTVKNMITALNKLGLSVMSVENASLRHLTGALKYSPNQHRAVIVNYLYHCDDTDDKWRESGHWATVSFYSAREGKIVLFDSYTGRKKSYSWKNFINYWKDYDLKRKRTSKRKATYTVVKKWKHRLMLVVAKDRDGLPDFTIGTSKIYSPDVL